MGRGKEAHRDFLLSIIDDPQAFLEVTDLVGLDVRLAIAEYLHRALGGGGRTTRRRQSLRDKVARGELGKKTGKGFYNWGAP